MPTITTANVIDITLMTADCGGTITAEGAGAVTGRGVCWSTIQNPTTSDNKTSDSSGVGSFTSHITGLTIGTTYYVRAYATNDAGTGYGNEITFASRDLATDIDGNIYQTIKIGSQWWMAENLKVTHYSNGDIIPNIVDTVEWGALTEGAYTNIYNDSLYLEERGRLYNWLAIADGRNIAPQGWHIPSDEEFKQMEKYLGMSQADADSWNENRGTDEGGKMKESGLNHWDSPNYGATNESGFSAVPAGYRMINGYYYPVGMWACFWSSTEHGDSMAVVRQLGNWDPFSDRFMMKKPCGLSVRCLKD